jgi:hypothetical protein
VRCKTCYYSLANLTEHRCPEPGTPFDPSDPYSFRMRPPVPKWRSAIDFIGGCMLYLVLISALALFVYQLVRSISRM